MTEKVCEALLREMRARIDVLQDFRRMYTSWHGRLTWLSLAVAALNTLAIALSTSGLVASNCQRIFGLIAIILSVAVTFIAGLQSALRFREKAISNALELNEVVDIEKELDWAIKKGTPITQDECDGFRKRFRTAEKAFFAEFAQLAAEPSQSKP